jgi:hypothetical protein
MARNFTLSQVVSLIAQYIERDGELHQIEEGCLGYGFLICTAENSKTAIIQEYFINEWSSGHKVTMYNKIPKKYAQIIQAL